MSEALTLSALPPEIQLCILQNLSTRRLLCQITRLSKQWSALACEVIRRRTVRLLSRPGVGIVFETSNPSNSDTKVYTLTPHPSGLFEQTECDSYARLPQLSLLFASTCASFEFNLDADEHFESFLWSACLSTHRSVQCRISPPASPRLLSFDRTFRCNELIQEGLDRLRRCEFPKQDDGVRVEERELTGDHGPALWLRTRLLPVQPISEKYAGGPTRKEGVSEFRAVFEGLRVDAASVVVACEDAGRGSSPTMIFCR